MLQSVGGYRLDLEEVAILWINRRCEMGCGGLCVAGADLSYYIAQKSEFVLVQVSGGPRWEGAAGIVEEVRMYSKVCCCCSARWHVIKTSGGAQGKDAEVG